MSGEAAFHFFCSLLTVKHQNITLKIQKMANFLSLTVLHKVEAVLEKGHGFILALQPFRDFTFLPQCSFKYKDILSGRRENNSIKEEYIVYMSAL